MTDSKTLTIIHLLINQNHISDLERELIGLLGCVRPDGLHLSQRWGGEPGSVKPGTGQGLALQHITIYLRNVTLSPLAPQLSLTGPVRVLPVTVLAQRRDPAGSVTPESTTQGPGSAPSCPHCFHASISPCTCE